MRVEGGVWRVEKAEEPADNEAVPETDRSTLHPPPSTLVVRRFFG
jgi:hypothetical protein